MTRLTGTRGWLERVELAGAGLPAAAVTLAGAPTRFSWAGRTYRVREVLAHWIEADPWWSQADAVGVAGPVSSQQWWRLDAQVEQRVARVSVASGAGGAGVTVATAPVSRIQIYDLCHDATGWWLVRIWD